MLTRGASLHAVNASEGRRPATPRTFHLDRETGEWKRSDGADVAAPTPAPAPPTHGVKPPSRSAEMLFAAMAATPSAPPVAPPVAPAPVVVAAAAPVPAPVVATAVQWSSSSNAAGVAYPGAAAQFQVLAPTTIVQAIAPLTGEPTTPADRVRALMHLDVMLPVIAAILVLLWLAAWAG